MGNKVITFVGMPGAGKSYCVEYLAKNDIPSVYFGGITIDEVKARGLAVNEQNEKTVREDIRRTEGKAAYAKRIIQKINSLFNSSQKIVVVDGLYSWTEYQEFKKVFDNDAIIIAIAAPRKLRHARLASRPVRPLTNQEVTLREQAEIENLEKGGPIANADYTILNNAAPEFMLNQLAKILEQERIAIK